MFPRLLAIQLTYCTSVTPSPRSLDESGIMENSF
jgi:hypothetical protein